MIKFLKSAIKSILPEELRKSLRRLGSRIRNFGVSCYCPSCGAHLRKFGNYGVLKRPDAHYPVCGSLERHRLMSLYFPVGTNLFDGTRKKMLHVATTEEQFFRVFSKIKGLDYLSADLDSPLAMVKMEITKIQYPDNTFDIIYCSHVLEHIPNDRLAMAELFRVLKPGGWAMLQVP